MKHKIQVLTSTILSLFMLITLISQNIQSNFVKAASLVDDTLIINDSSLATNEGELHKFFYSGKWESGPNGNCFGNDEHYIRGGNINKDSYITIPFDGTGIEVYAITKNKHGKMDVVIDDQKVAEIDEYSASDVNNQKVFGTNNLKKGQHTLKLIPNGKKNELSKASDIQIDFVKVLGYTPKYEITTSPEFTVVEDSSVTSSNELFKIQYNGNWIGESGYDNLFHNGDDHYSNDGGSFKMEFIGNVIEVYASVKNEHGNYDVYIDGEFAGDAIANTSEVKHQQLIFKKEGLTDGKHSIDVRLKEETADKAIQLDYLKVYHSELNPIDINLYDKDITLESGTMAAIDYSLYPVNATNKEVVWESSDTSVVSNDGNIVKAVSEEKADVVITASIKGTDIKKSVNVHVVPSTDVVNAYVGSVEKLDTKEEYETLKYGYGTSFSDVAWKGDVINSKIIVTSKEEGLHNAKITSSDFTSMDSSIKAENVDIRWLKDVYVSKGWGSGINKEYPDVIYKGGNTDIEPMSVKSSWININIPKDAKPGIYNGILTLTADELENPIKFNYQIEVVDLIQPLSEDTGTLVELWQYPFAVAEYYGLDESQYFTEEHFKYYRKNMEAYKETGGTAVTATIVEEAWNHQSYYGNPSMIKWTKKSDGTFEFDYTWYDKWIQEWIKEGVLKPEEGIGEIQCYSIVPWGNIVTYYDEEKSEIVKETLNPGSKEWKEAWTAFLTDFVKHSEDNGWLDITYISMDERPMDSLKPAVELIKSIKGESGKTLKIFSAFNYRSQSDYEFTDQIDDISVGLTSVDHGSDVFEKFVEHRKEINLKTTIYTCTGMYPNSFMNDDTIGSEWTMWYSLSVGADGFLRWAIDNWVDNQLEDAGYVKFEPGDCFFIYPTEKDGSNPEYIYSTPRYEMLKRGIRDINKAKYLMSLSDTTKVQVEELVKSLERPTSKNSELMINEVSRMREGIMEISRSVSAKADYSKVEDAIEKAKSFDENLYKNYDKVKEAIENVEYGLNISKQAEVDAMAQNILDAIKNLEYKDADYSKVDAAIQKAENLNPKDYKDFSGVENAVNAVVRGKNITEQKEVDAMAEAIQKAIDELQRIEINKDILYSVLQKYAGYHAEDYTIESWTPFKKAYDEASEVYSNKNATQEEVNNAVEELEKVAKNLVKAEKPVEPETPVDPEDKPGDTSESTTAPDKNETEDVTTGVQTNAGMLMLTSMLAGAGVFVALRKRKEKA